MYVFKNSEEKVQKSTLQQFSVQTWNANGYNELIKNNLTKSGNEVDITGITEMHTKHGDAVLKGNLLLSGCGDVNDKFAGVGLLLSEKARNALVTQTLSLLVFSWLDLMGDMPIQLLL